MSKIGHFDDSYMQGLLLFDDNDHESRYVIKNRCRIMKMLILMTVSFQ